ncbi:MAG TPA: thioredoxin domain-containing protein [Candidatus Bilamarchaeum sp.]|nr:thioredoxin domain-containing protein [Candidatus Bilamarchaeum sp.]
MEKDTVTFSKDSLYGIVIVSLAALLALSVMTGGFGIVKGEAQNPGGAAAPAAVSGRMVELMDDDMRLGSDSAPVVIVEFSDFQCPFCRKFWADSYQNIKKEYIDTGKVQLVYRDFPLSFHPSAQKSAEAAECAADEGKGWEMHDKMYSEEAKLGAGTVQYTDDDLKRWASEIGLDAAKFNDCLSSGKYAAEVQKDETDGQGAGVTGTPSFIIGRRDGTGMVPVSGAQPYSVFKSNIDQLLQ